MAHQKELALAKHRERRQKSSDYHPQPHNLSSPCTQPPFPHPLMGHAADVLAGSVATNVGSISQGLASTRGVPSSLAVSVVGCKKDNHYKADGVPLQCLHKAVATEMSGAAEGIVELSDDDEVARRTVVTDVSDDDSDTQKREIIDLSSQEVSSSACFDRLYHNDIDQKARAGGRYEAASYAQFDRLCPEGVHTTTSSLVEQDNAKGELVRSSAGILYYRMQIGGGEEDSKIINRGKSELQDGVVQHSAEGELVRSTAGMTYYRMPGLDQGGEERKITSTAKSKSHGLDEIYNGTFSTLTVLPSSLSKQQQLVLKAVAAGKSVFLTGAAGTGKSFLLGFAIDILKSHLGQHSVFVVASTGLAACALSGTTIHSFAGIGLGKEQPDVLANKVLRSKEAVTRWRNARALIIDEVSMIDGELFDKLDYVAKVVRADSLKDKPLHKSFGGIQLIVTGDFFQLPPVKFVNQRKFFAFEADCWNRCFDVQIELKQIFRQDDGDFAGMLNKIRKGYHTPETLLPLHICFRELPDDGSGIKATRLYPLKHDVNQENMSTLQLLNREISVFTALDWARSSYHQSMLQNVRAEKSLRLCIGAQVMLVKNIDTSSGLVNGARGVVIGYSSQSILHDKDVDLRQVTEAVSLNGHWPVVQFACDGSQRVIGPHKDSIEDGGWEVASRIQVPLILAWALSVHKCQGMTLDRVIMDLSKAFGFGMVYVALSRVKNLNGLQLTGFDPSLIKVNWKVVQFYEGLDGD